MTYSISIVWCGLQWGRGCVATEMYFTVSDASDTDEASMGPWLCSHGNQSAHLRSGQAISLQWGRGCVATEMVTAARSYVMYEYASMGPWLCSHGNHAEWLAVVLEPHASMGPWLCSHGNDGLC